MLADRFPHPAGNSPFGFIGEIDKSGANTAAIKQYNQDNNKRIKIRQRKYLNNIIEQDQTGCSYTRERLPNERLKLNSAGDVVLQLKSPYQDGTTHIVMTPLEFMQRLAALVPRPRLNLIRFHGVLAPNAKLRAEITQQPELLCEPKVIQPLPPEHVQQRTRQQLTSRVYVIARGVIC